MRRRNLGVRSSEPGGALPAHNFIKELGIDMDKEIKITQVRSIIGRLPAHRRTVKALGLRRIGHTVIQKDNPAIRGMINTVSYLLRVEE